MGWTQNVESGTSVRHTDETGPWNNFWISLANFYALWGFLQFQSFLLWSVHLPNHVWWKASLNGGLIFTYNDDIDITIISLVGCLDATDKLFNALHSEHLYACDPLLCVWCVISRGFEVFFFSYSFFSLLRCVEWSGLTFQSCYYSSLLGSIVFFSLRLFSLLRSFTLILVFSSLSPPFSTGLCFCWAVDSRTRHAPKGGAPQFTSTSSAWS